MSGAEQLLGRKSVGEASVDARGRTRCTPPRWAMRSKQKEDGKPSDATAVLFYYQHFYSASCPNPRFAVQTRDHPFSTMYLGLKSGVLILNIACFPLFFIAAIMDRWIVWPSIPANLGLMRYCNQGRCGFLNGYADSAFWLLMTSLLLPIVLSLPCAIWEVWYARKGRLGCLSYIAGLQFLTGILAFAGMINGTVLLNKLARTEEGYSNYSWSYALGWLGVILTFGAGALSVYIYRIEPRDPVDETQILKLPDNWQPELPKFQSPNEDWQPQPPELQLPPPPPGKGTPQGGVQPQHFTWQPNQGVPQAQQPPWQPTQPHHLAPEPQQGAMQPQPMELHI